MALRVLDGKPTPSFSALILLYRIRRGEVVRNHVPPGSQLSPLASIHPLENAPVVARASHGGFVKPPVSPPRRRQRLAPQDLRRRNASAVRSLHRRGPLPGRGTETGPQGFERTVAFALHEAPNHIGRPAARRRMAAAQRKRWAAARHAKAAAPATPAPAKAARRKRRLSPLGARADHRGDEEAVGGAGEGQSGGEISRAEESDTGGLCEARGGQTGPEARWPKQRGQEIKAGGRAAEGRWPDEGGGAPAAPSRNQRRDRA